MEINGQEVKVDENTKVFDSEGEEVTQEEVKIITKPNEKKKKEEPVRKDKAYFGIDESFPNERKYKKEEENLVDQQVDEEQDYLVRALNEGTDPNILAYVKYNALGLKQKEGKQLTEDETLFLKDMNALIEAENKAQQELEQGIKEQEAVKQKVLEDYAKEKQVNPTRIDVVDTNKTFNGGDSLPKFLKFAMTLKTAKKKGGKILVKVTRDRDVIIEWTNKEVGFVEFWTTDEKGTKIPEVTRFNEFKYNYEGSPVPVLFAVQGYAEGFDFFGEFRKDITSEMVSRIASRARHSGFLEGINQREQGAKKGIFAGLEPFMPIIILGGFILMIFMMYLLYGEVTNMIKEVEAVKQAVGVMVLQ